MLPRALLSHTLATLESCKGQEKEKAKAVFAEATRWPSVSCTSRARLMCRRGAGQSVVMLTEGQAAAENVSTEGPLK